MTMRMLVVRGSSLLLERLAVVPRGEFIVVPDAATGEAHLGNVDAVYLGDRIRPAYLQAPGVRWLHIAGAGVDGFSIAGLRDAPFVITHKVHASVIPMAEHVMAQILLIARRALDYRELQAKKEWAGFTRWPTTGLIQVHGKTLGLVGLGHAGLAIARRAKPFGMRVVGVKRTAVDHLPHVDAIYPVARLREMLAESDFVAITAPLTDATYHLVGEAELRAMKPMAYLINHSRGPIVDETALIRALQEGWLAGASLDVFEHEPLDPASPLWEMPNVIVTSHCGGVGPNLAEDTVQEIVTNLRRFLAGRPLLYQLNRADVVTTFEPPRH
jgi:phosphoglycerate dehydrogenase-like enzyme